MVRRLVICALTAGAAVLVATSALAHPGDEAGSSKTTFTRKTDPVTWTMKAGQCSQLPADLSVDGTGSKTTTIAGSVDSRGKHLDVYTETASGTAKDSAGATYTWDYQFTQVGVYKRYPYVAWASDSFDLVAADGTVKVHAFFLAKVRYKNASDQGTYTTTFTVGDPVAFNPFVPHCDAL